MTETQVKINEMDYETTLARLHDVITKLEDQEQTLDSGLTLFEEGQLLLKHCASLLDKAELKVKTLLSDDLAQDMDEE